MLLLSYRSSVFVFSFLTAALSCANPWAAILCIISGVILCFRRGFRVRHFGVFGTGGNSKSDQVDSWRFAKDDGGRSAP